MQQSKLVEFWVGLFVAIGCLGLFFLAMQVSNLSSLKTGDKGYKIIARFANAGSLKVRSPVSMSGVRIGRVSAIRFDKQAYEAVVEMQIDPEFDNLPSDTSAKVLTAGLLGEQYVGLTPGGMDDYLKEGDQVELTQSAIVFEEVISRFLFNKAEGGDKKSEESTAEQKPVLDEVEKPEVIAPVKPKPAEPVVPLEAKKPAVKALIKPAPVKAPAPAPVPIQPLKPNPQAPQPKAPVK